MNDVKVAPRWVVFCGLVMGEKNAFRSISSNAKPQTGSATSSDKLLYQEFFLPSWYLRWTSLGGDETRPDLPAAWQESRAQRCKRSVPAVTRMLLPPETRLVIRDQIFKSSRVHEQELKRMIGVGLVYHASDTVMPLRGRPQASIMDPSIGLYWAFTISYSK